MSNPSDLHRETMNSSQQTDPGSAGSSTVGSRYTRRQAIDDGALMDVSLSAWLLGIELPVFLAARAYSRCVLDVQRAKARQDAISDVGFLWQIQRAFEVAIRKGIGRSVLVGAWLACSQGNTDEMVSLVVRHETFDIDDATPVLLVALQEEETQQPSQSQQ